MDGARFDALTRGLAGGMTRPKLLRGLAGVAAAGIAGASGTSSFSAPKNDTGKPSARAYVCPDVEVSTTCPYSIDPPAFDVLSCENRGGTLLQTRRPTYNGLCDVPIASDFDLTEGVRDRYGKASFEDACFAHDCCYDTCGTDRYECDSNFLEAMTESCEASYQDNALQRELCVGRANDYYFAVVGPWNNGAHPFRQEMNCTCCAQDPLNITVTPNAPEPTRPSVTPPPTESPDQVPPTPSPTQVVPTQSPTQVIPTEVVVDCPEGRFVCGEVCIDPIDDPLHCGGCGNACGTYEHCLGGVCEKIWAPEPTMFPTSTPTEVSIPSSSPTSTQAPPT